MKKHFILILACIALVCFGCKESNVPDDLHYLDGLWGLTTNKTAPADGRYEEYVHFYTDKSFEYFYVTASAYVYHWGVYDINQGKVTLTYKGLRRFDMAEDTPRYTNDYFVENSLDQTVVTIKDYGTDKMIFKTSSGNCYFFKAVQIYGWNEEFSAPAVSVSEQALLGQWDQLNFYQYSWQGTTWWYFYEPEKNGVTLAENGGMTDCPFWASRLMEKMINAGKLTASEQVELDPANCAWSLSTDTLKMTCTTYLAYTPDEQGNRTAEHIETPEQPVTISFLVQTLTPYYLILYNGEMELFHAFHKHPAEGAKVAAATPDNRLRIMHATQGVTASPAGLLLKEQ